MDNRFLNSSAAVDRWFYVPVKCSGITKISYNGEAVRGGDAIESISFFFLFYSALKYYIENGFYRCNTFMLYFLRVLPILSPFSQSRSETSPKLF